MKVEIFQADEDGTWEIIGNGEILFNGIHSIEAAEEICAARNWIVKYD